MYNYGADYIDEESQDYDNDFPLTQVTPADVADVSREKVHNVVGPDSVGFAAKYASEAIGKAVDAEVAGSMNFLLPNKLSKFSRGEGHGFAALVLAVGPQTALADIGRLADFISFSKCNHAF